ncbi:hypothetical protein Nepgr_016120 [Nepenthes gracilis]|uniref:Aspartate racemase n=1 Tax=Nepenthes gracilis TaxID=150966 RepID=A0AAD3XRR6_NEPGR|nr:hypothetical protein Nepgr_016120 [Nepenthes gracilis]
MIDEGTLMSSYTLGCPSLVSGKMHKLGTLRKTRLLPPVVANPSSVLIQTCEGYNSPHSKRNLASNGQISLTISDSGNPEGNQANTVGILGGVSVDSTVSFLHKLRQWSSEEGKDCPPFVLCSHPPLKEDLFFHGGPFPSLNGRNQPTRLDVAPIIANLQHKRRFLEHGGAQCIVMPCNVLRLWHDEISQGCSVPFLHMGECVAMEVKEANMKPLEAGSPLRIGFLDTYAALTAGFYQEKLQNEGFEVVLPDKATMEHTLLPAIEALERKDIEGAQNLLRIALQVLLVRAVNAVILASDDLRDLLPRDDPLLRKCIDPMDALVRATIRWARVSEDGT